MNKSYFILWLLAACLLILQAVPCSAASLRGIILNLVKRSNEDDQCFIRIGGRYAVPEIRGFSRKVVLLAVNNNDLGRAKWTCRPQLEGCEENQNCYTFEYVFPGAKRRWFLCADGKTRRANGPEKADVIMETLNPLKGFRVLGSNANSGLIFKNVNSYLTLGEPNDATSDTAESFIQDA